MSLSEKDKEGYRDKIKKATDHFKLVELDQLLTQLQEKETQDAVDKAKTALPKHMTTRLEEVDQLGSTFPNLLEKLKNVITKYSGLFDDALNRKKVEELEQRAQEEMDTYISEYKKGLTAAPGDNANPADKDQAGKGADQGAGSGDNKGVGQGDKGKPAGDVGKPSPRNQTFTGTAGGVKVTVLFDKSVNAEKVTIKEVTQPDLVDRISRQAGGGSIRLFDLSLTKNGKETHVNEERTVRLALEGLGGDVQVYHVRPDGQLEPIPSRVEDGHVIFRINHFSLFAIKTTSSKSGQETPSNQATPSTQAKSTPKEMAKDTASKKTLPNTGTADSTALLAAAASTAILGLGLAGRRRKED